MRITALVLVLLCAPAGAGPRVVVMTDTARGDALPAALQVALANRRVVVASLPAPDGALRADRTAAVQHAAQASDADAGVWIEIDDGGPQVCVVSADGHARQTPLPPDATPRVFAAIATSLLDELLAPPAISVDVHVDVQPGALAPPAPPPLAPPALQPLAPPALQPAVPAADARAADSDEPVRAHERLVEIGLMATPVSYGIEGELALPLAASWRLGVFGGINHMFDDFASATAGSMLADAGGELRHVGSGATHYDIGLAAGVAHGDMDNVGGFAELRLSAVHEYARTAVSLSVAPMALLDFLGQSNTTFAVMGSLRLGIPI